MQMVLGRPLKGSFKPHKVRTTALGGKGAFKFYFIPYQWLPATPESGSSLERWRFTASAIPGGSDWCSNQHRAEWVHSIHLNTHTHTNVHAHPHMYTQAVVCIPHTCTHQLWYAHSIPTTQCDFKKVCVCGLVLAFGGTWVGWGDVSRIQWGNSNH